MMVEDPDIENSLFSEPMKMRTPSARSARLSRSITSRRDSRSSNRSRTRSRSSSTLRSSSRCAWPRTISLRRGTRLLKLAARLGERLAADARVEKVGRFGERRGRQTDRHIDDAVFDLSVLADHHDQRALGIEPHELDV